MISRYSKEEIKYLKENYSKENKNTIINNLKNRTWGSIQKKAFLLNLKRDLYTNRFSGKLKKLLNNTPESFYWLGFLMADAHISNKNNIQLNISKKDEKHLDNLKNFLNYDIKKYYSKKTNSVRIILSDQETILKIKNQYSWLSNKTYTPIKLSKIDKSNLTFLLIGFIDGDGSINKKGKIYIKCHSSYIDFLKILLVNYSTSVKINKDGLVLACITKIEKCKKLKKIIIDNKLPVLQRKWNRINFNMLSKTERSEEIKNKCFKYFDKNIFNCKLVTKNEDISESSFYKYLNIYKKK